MVENVVVEPISTPQSIQPNVNLPGVGAATVDEQGRVTAIKGQAIKPVQIRQFRGGRAVFQVQGQEVTEFKSSTGFTLPINVTIQSTEQLRVGLSAGSFAGESAEAVRQLIQSRTRAAAGFGIPEETTRAEAAVRGVPEPTPRVPTPKQQKVTTTDPNLIAETVRKKFPRLKEQQVNQLVQQQLRVVRAQELAGRPVGIPRISEKDIRITKLEKNIDSFNKRFAVIETAEEDLQARIEQSKLQAEAKRLGVKLDLSIEKSPPGVSDVFFQKVIVEDVLKKPIRDVKPELAVFGIQETEIEKLRREAGGVLPRELTKEEFAAQQKIAELRRGDQFRIKLLTPTEEGPFKIEPEGFKQLTERLAEPGLFAKEQFEKVTTPEFATIAALPAAAAGGVFEFFGTLGGGTVEAIVPPGTIGRGAAAEATAFGAELVGFGAGATALRVTDVALAKEARAAQRIIQESRIVTESQKLGKGVQKDFELTLNRLAKRVEPPPKAVKVKAEIPKLRDITTGEILTPTQLDIESAFMKKALVEFKKPTEKIVPEVTPSEFDKIVRSALEEQRVREVRAKALEPKPFGLGKPGRPKKLKPIDIEPKPTPETDIERFLLSVTEIKPRKPFGLGRPGRPKKLTPLEIGLPEEEQIRLAVSRLPKPEAIPELKPFGLGRPGRPKKLVPISLEPAEQLRRIVSGLRPTEPVSEFKLFGLGRRGRPKKLAKITTAEELQRALEGGEAFVTTQEELARAISGLGKRLPKPPKAKLFDKKPDVPPAGEFEKIVTKSDITLIRLPGEARTREFQRLLDLERGRRFRLTKAQKEEAKALERLGSSFIPGSARALGAKVPITPPPIRGKLGTLRISPAGEVLIPIGKTRRGTQFLAEDVTFETTGIDIRKEVFISSRQDLKLIQPQLPVAKAGVVPTLKLIPRLEEKVIKASDVKSLEQSFQRLSDQEITRGITRTGSVIVPRVGTKARARELEQELELTRTRTRLLGFGLREFESPRLRPPRFFEEPRPPTGRRIRRPPPFIFPILFKGERVRKRGLVPEFQAFIRRFGTFVPIGKRGTEAFAATAGARAAKFTLGRTFIIERTGRLVKPTSLKFPSLSGQFRRPKGKSVLPAKAFVEKAKFALLEEQPAIQRARRRKQGRRTKSFLSSFSFGKF